MVDDHLINNTQGTNGANRKRLQVPGEQMKRRTKSRERYGTYWDKKTDAPESDDAAKTDPIKRENALIS
jgi:hypothetical protein